MTVDFILEAMTKRMVTSRFPIEKDQILEFGDIIVRRNSRFMIVLKDMKEDNQVLVMENYRHPYIRERKNIWFSTSLNNFIKDELRITKERSASRARWKKQRNSNGV